MFGKLLIANRGEIACRIARTARRLGVRTVAIYSDADAGALHVEAADEAVRIGASPPRESYLDAAAIVAAARHVSADAVHPGYGFLSENEAFARACGDAGVVFVGPPPAAIAAMGSKSAAKSIMVASGVPVVPGYHADDQDASLLAREADRIGFPVLVKATAGGGGKGMKVARTPDELPGAIASARREARAAFGDDRVLLERYLTAPRHIEIQVFADSHRNVVHLFERDCSVQRRHQKVLEEAPAPGMDAARRSAMGDAAIAAATAIGYVGAGTVEFIVDEAGAFFFMEMNTRLQVEHPVTEMITGLDLVEWQLRVACGEPLPKSQPMLNIDGHAIEARVYAEDPDRGFLPSTGRITHWRMPVQTSRVRVDTGVREGDEISAFYDPMLAKVIAWGEDRERARIELARALSACQVVGVSTNIAFLERVVGHGAFAAGQVDTGLIDAHSEALVSPAAEISRHALIGAAVAEYRSLECAARDAARSAPDPHSPWNLVDAWWNGASTHHLSFTFDDGQRLHAITVKPRGDGWIGIGGVGIDAEVHAEPRGDALWLETREPGGGAAHRDGQLTSVVRDGDVRHVFAPGVRARLSRVDPLAAADVDADASGHLAAPMSGTVVAVLVQPGDTVGKGAPLVVLEAMKMEHTIVAPAAGSVTAVRYAIGDRVSEGADLVDMAVADDR